jgi:hypothetical protein
MKEEKMKRSIVYVLIMLFLTASCAVTSARINKKSVESAKIEKVEYKPDEKGNYYVYVTIKNMSSKARPFYLALQADDQVPQFTASGKKGQPTQVPAGENYTFKVNTWKKAKPQKLQIEVKETLR